jgi:hypothetical protein
LCIACLCFTGCGYIAIGVLGGVLALQNKNNNNLPTPTPVDVLTPPTAVNDRVALSYVLTDPSIPAFDVLVSYSTNGVAGPFNPATEAQGSPSEGTAKLSASAAGNPHVFVWNSFFDLDARGTTNSPNVVIRVTALTTTGGSSYGKPGFTTPFSLDNRLIATVAGQPGVDFPGTGILTVPLNAPTSAAVISGDFLVADTGSSLIRLGDTSAKNAVIFGGTASAGFGGDNGPAAAASLLAPRCVVVGALGNVFIADTGNNRIRMINKQGIIVTVAGTGAATYSGDGGSAASATLNAPAGLAIDGLGDLVICDTNNNCVRLVDSLGMGSISTIAGTGLAGSAGDGAAATSAQLSAPGAACVDLSSGTIYVADTGNHAVRAFKPGGTIATVAGVTGSAGAGADAVPATASQLNSPQGVCILNGEVVVADTNNHRIRKFKPGSTIATIAGLSVAGVPTPGFSGDGGAAGDAAMNTPTGLSSDGAGGFLVADTGNDRIRQVRSTGTITTVMGSGTLPAGYIGDGGPATKARFGGLDQLFRAPSGTFFVADGQFNRIRSFTLNGNISTVLGGASRAVTYATTPIPTAQVTLSTSRGVTVDANGIIFEVGANDDTVQAVNPATGLTVSIAGTGVSGSGANGVPPLTSALNGPKALLVLPGNIILVAETSGNRIRQFAYTVSPAGVVAATGNITLACGTGSAGFSGDNGPATSANIRTPQGMALDPNGNVVFSDSGNSVVRRFTLGGNVTTIAGNGAVGFSGDGALATQASLSGPTYVTVDLSQNVGTIYVADTGNNRVRQVTPSGIISTVAGTGDGSSDIVDGTPALSVALPNPTGIAVDSAGGVLVCLTGTRRIARFLPGGNATVVAGAPALSSIGDGGPANQGQLVIPVGVNVDPGGHGLYVSDNVGFRVRFVDFATGLISTVAGIGIGNDSGGNGGLATQATINTPTNVAQDSLGNVYIGNSSGAVIHQIGTSGLLTVFAGTGAGFSGDGGPANLAQFNQASAVAVNTRTGKLYLSDVGNARIREIDLSTNIVTTVCGTGSKPTTQLSNVPATTVSLATPQQLSVDVNSGFVYVAEFTGHRVDKFLPGGNFFVLAGSNSGTPGFSGDNGLAVNATLSSPFCVATDQNGNVYIADSGNNRVRLISPNGIITTIAGNGMPNGGGDGVIATQTTINFPKGVGSDGNGNIYVSESLAGRVRRFRIFP